MTIPSAVRSTQSVRSFRVLGVGPGHGDVSSGQCSHQVIDWPPGFTFSHVLLRPHVFPSCTELPGVATQSSRLAAATHACIGPPVRQQNGGLATGSRLPHLSWILFCFEVSAAASFSWSVGSARQAPRVLPFSMHFSIWCSTLMR